MKKEIIIIAVSNILKNIDSYMTGENNPVIPYTRRVLDKIKMMEYKNKEQEIEALYFASIGMGVLS